MTVATLPTFCPTLWTGTPTPVSPAPIAPGGVRQSGCPDVLTGTDVRTVTLPTNATAADFQYALNNAVNLDGTHKGHTIVVPAGMVFKPSGGFFSTPPTTGDGWTIIKTGGTLPAKGTRVTPANAGAMFKLLIYSVIEGFGFKIPYGSNGWRFIGLELTHDYPGPYIVYRLIEVGGSRVSFEQCYIHGYPGYQWQRRAFLIAGCDIQVWDSWISEWHDDSDSQAIWVINRADYSGIYSPAANDRIHIENNHISGAAETIMLGDGTASYASRYVTILRNRFYKPPTWQQFLRTGHWSGPDWISDPNPNWDGILRVIKNIFEIKAAQHVLVQNNLMENCWGYGLGGAQPGEAFVLNTGAILISDVMFRSNRILNGTMLATISAGYASPGKQPQRIAMVNNLGLNCGDQLGFHNWGNYDVIFEHNTWIPDDGIANVSAGNSWIRGLSWQQVRNTQIIFRNTVRRNIFGSGSYGVALGNLGAASEVLSDAAFNVEMPDREHYRNAIYGGGSVGSLAGFRSYPSLAGAGINTDGTLQTNSPLKAGGEYDGGDGKDLGVDFSLLDETSPPEVVQTDFAYTPVADTYQVNFTDETTGGTPTTWDWNWGDNTTHGTTENPSHTYTTPGQKQVTLLTDLGQITKIITVPVITAFDHVNTFANEFEPLSTTTPTVTPSAIAVGDLCFVYVSQYAGSSIDSVTDSLGNTYTPFAYLRNEVEGRARGFWTVASFGGSNPIITAHLGSTADFARITFQRFLPKHTTPTLIDFAQASGSGVSPMDSGAADSAVDDIGLFGFCVYNLAIPTPQNADWIARSLLPSSANVKLVFDNLAARIAGTYRFQPVFIGTQAWWAQLAIFDSASTPDTTDPTISIQVPSSSIIVPATPTVLSGIADDNIAVTEITWANDRGGSGTAAGTNSWSFSCPLQEGLNVITVTAHDAAGNTTAVVRNITLQTVFVPPLIPTTLRPLATHKPPVTAIPPIH